jgi:dipeptidyl aminopeptidase/acylaminoacyl peptidase
MCRLSILVAVCVIAFAAAAAAEAKQAKPKTVGPADIVELRDVLDPQISPDGRTVLFVVETMLDDGKTKSGIWQVPVAGHAPAKPFIDGGSATSPRWSPDGKTVAYLAESATADPGKGTNPGEDEHARIWLTGRNGGKATAVSRVPGDIKALQWSHDGSRIAFTMAEPPTAAARAEKAAKRDASPASQNGPRARLWILDVKSGEAQAVTPPELQINAFDWAPDGKHLAVQLAASSGINDFFYQTRLRILDLDDGRLGPVIAEHVMGAAHWSPDGRSIAYATLGKDYISATPALYSVAAGTSHPVLAAFPGLVLDMQWLPDSRTLVAEAVERTKMSFLHVDAASGKAAKIGENQAITGAFSLSGDGRTIAYFGSSAHSTGNVWILDAAKKKNTPRTDINPQVSGWKLGNVREISWRARSDGRILYGVLVTPPGFKPGTPAKTVVQVHGGPEWWWWSGWLGSWHEWAQMLASHGYVVFLPNPRGSDGQGTEFARLVRNDFGGADFQDILDGLDLLVREKITDPARVGIGGWSYGGYMSAWAVSHSTRFKTAIAGAGIADIRTMGLGSDTPDFIAGYFDRYITDPGQAEARSPLNHVNRIEVPMLILQGENDTRVPIGQSQALYAALKSLGKPVEFVKFPREPHWFVEKGHKRQILEYVLDWYDHHL